MNNQGLAAPQNEVRIKDVVQTLWRHKTKVFIFVFVSTAASTAASYWMTKQYGAATTVSPASSSSNNSSGALGSLSNNLAALAGVPLTSDPKKVESIAILQSEALTERYITENGLLQILYASKWDSIHGRWNVTDPEKTPTPWKANQYFKKSILKVTTDGKTGLVTVTVTWKDPVQAAQWANGLVKMANSYERDSTLAESDRNIAYLTDQAAKTDVIGIKQAIYSLLESEFDKAMLAKGNNEYAFKIIDPATVPEKASSPKKSLWLLGAFFASLLISVFAAFCAVAWRSA